MRNEESITDLMQRMQIEESEGRAIAQDPNLYFTGRPAAPVNPPHVKWVDLTRLPDRVNQLEKELEATKIELKVLRKEYDNHLVQALWISGGTVLLFIGLTLLA